jgi:micrococcal nuclease
MMAADAPIILSCPAPTVHDGDTFRCPNGRNMRLARIDAPELASSPACGRRKIGVVCDQAAAIRSRDYLKRLLAAGRWSCRIVDASPRYRGFQAQDRYGRPVVRCAVNGRDVGEAMIAAGHAKVWPPR